MAKTMIGRNGMMGPVPVIPRTSANQPHWKTATVTPIAAPRDSRLVTAPVRGTRSERKRITRATKPRPMTTVRNNGKASVSTVVKSDVMACVPPT